MNNYTFFWAGPFSQWYPSKFIVEGQEFTCAEQFMMYSKAMLFGDIDAANKILHSTNPKEQKQLGRSVRNFNVDRWDAVAQSVVYTGNMEKFTQNPKLLEQLLATGETVLVEASPYDKIWGIGLTEAVAKVTPVEQWRGTNYLGKVLTRVRDDIKLSS